ncbi:MAG TPA: thioredoxin domain-containing protein [Solirubrobacteraceae bacterium]|nr:thioredoxin domain-containing protein [Solirubrobacteraceae bacterium]
MASRAEQKAAARAAREARLKAASKNQARNTRLMKLGGLVAGVAIVIVVIVVAVGGGSSTLTPKKTKALVTSLLAGIPQSGNTLGNPNAKITVVEYGDLVCPICQEFAVGGEASAIRNEVRQGKVKFVYRATETASGSNNNGEFVAGQVAAKAAGLQHKEWNYILTWYNEQKSETTPYVTNGWLQQLAQQIPGLNLAKWQQDRNSTALANQVKAEEQDIADLVAQKAIPAIETPTLVFTGPKGTPPPVQAALTYSDLKTAFKEVT